MAQAQQIRGFSVADIAYFLPRLAKEEEEEEEEEEEQEGDLPRFPHVTPPSRPLAGEGVRVAVEFALAHFYRDAIY